MTEPTPPVEPVLSEKVRNLGMAMHLLALVGYLGNGIGVLAPGILWFLQKDEDHFLDECGKEALNFNLTYVIFMVLYLAIAWPLTIVLVGFILLALLPVFWVAHIALVILAGLKARDGYIYRYPFTIRFLK